MKKIKISELPLFSSLKGLYTLGTDSANRSVKVSLEFIESATTEAVNKANAATEAAVTAKENAETATQNANAATTAANNAADAAMTAKENADTATGNANDAAQAATQAKTDAETATQNANTATAAAQQAKKDAEAATEAAAEATEAAEYAAERVITLIGQLVPTSLTVDSVPRLTIGNVQPVYINASLTPSQVMKNLIFISDGKAVTVSPDGRLTIVATGRSTVQVIPTINTALAKVIQVEVGEATLRMTTKTSMRFTSSGGLRLN